MICLGSLYPSQRWICSKCSWKKKQNLLIKKRLSLVLFSSGLELGLFCCTWGETRDFFFFPCNLICSCTEDSYKLVQKICSSQKCVPFKQKPLEMTLGFIFHSWQINIDSFELEYLIFFKVSVTYIIESTETWKRMILLL